MASDLIKRDSIRAAVALYMGSNAYLNDTALDVLKMIDKWLCEAEAVDAVPIDTVAEMLAGMYGDCCPCNYLDIDEGISVDCKRKNCPGFFETDYSCWKKYIEYWMKRKLDGGKQDAQETTL